MIVRIKGPPPDGKERGFLALHKTDGGRWVPISEQLTRSRHAAAQECIQAARRQLQKIDGAIADRLEIVASNLERLWSHPTEGDAVFVDGVPRRVDEDGFLRESDSCAEDSGEIQLETVQALIEVATGNREMTDDDRFVVDLARDEPLELLALVK